MNRAVIHTHEPCCYDSGARSIGPESHHYTKFARLSGIDAIVNQKHREAIHELGIIGDSSFVGHAKKQRLWPALEKDLLPRTEFMVSCVLFPNRKTMCVGYGSVVIFSNVFKFRFFWLSTLSERRTCQSQNR
jgi:hypothetical protein